jgi:hypothetical protein
VGKWYIPNEEEIRPPILEHWPGPANDRPDLTISAEILQDRAVRFTASASDGDGIKAHQWHFGDLAYADGADVSHTYLRDGVYAAICYVADNTGNTSWKAVRVTIGRGK